MLLSRSLLWVFVFVAATTSQAFLPRNSKLNVKLQRVVQRSTCLEMNPSTNLVSLLQFNNDDVTTAFSIATFFPQPFWLLMILAPNWSFTNKILKPWWSVVAFSLVHLFTVVVSASQTDGTAPLAEFAGVFDPSGDPQEAMMGMMKYPNFVTGVNILPTIILFSSDLIYFASEEWSHVLTWDFFVGRFIWMDGLTRGVFTPHSVLLANLIGPPGLLLHYLTCFVTGKSAPDFGSFANPVAVIDPSSSESKKEFSPNMSWLPNLFGEFKSKSQASGEQPLPPSNSPRADTIVKTLFSSLYDATSGVSGIVSILADNVIWEDTSRKDPVLGKTAVEALLTARVSAASPKAFLAIEKLAEGATFERNDVLICSYPNSAHTFTGGSGQSSSGFTWHLEERDRDAKGLQGTTFISLDASGKINYVREVAEPLFKPGSATAGLLKAVAESGLKKEKEERFKRGIEEPPAREPFKRRDLINAADTVSYLWLEVQGSDKEEALRLFSDDIIYEDLNFASPFTGKSQVSEFLDEFDIPGIRFVPERISEGTGRGCCFTWHVEIAGTDGQVKGISFYEMNEEGKVSYIRDVPEPAIKPPPLQSLAALIEPGLRCLPRPLA